MHLVGLLPHPSTAPFDHEHPYNTHHLLTCRATGCPSCTSVYCQWALRRTVGKKQENSFLLSQLEIFVITAGHPRHHGAPWGAHTAALVATARSGLIGGCFHFPASQAGIPAVQPLGLHSTRDDAEQLCFPTSLPRRLTAWCMGMCELCCSHSHLSHMLNGSWEHKIRLLWSS